MVDAAKTGAWDMAFLGIDPAREGEIGFTAAYLEIEATYLVPAGSRIATVADVDRGGVRVVAAARANYELFLTRELKRAELVRAPGHPAAFEILQGGRADALAGLRQALLGLVERLPGSRVLDGRFMGVPQAIGALAGPRHGGSRSSAASSRTRRRPAWSPAGSSARVPGACRWRPAWSGRPGPNGYPDFLYGTAWKEDRTAELTELALRSGFRAIDTANQRRHYFEAGVGQGLAAAYRAGLVTRADLFLQTKFTYRAARTTGCPTTRGRPVDPGRAVDGSSLEHLGTDHVDS